MSCCSLCYILFKNVSKKFETIFVAKSSNSCKNSVFEIWLFRHLQLAARSARTNNFDTDGVRTHDPYYTSTSWYPLDYSVLRVDYFLGILLFSISSPLLSYLIFRESWLDIWVLIWQNNWLDNFDNSKRLWFIPKNEIVSERRSCKIPFGVPNEGAGSVV